MRARSAGAVRPQASRRGVRGIQCPLDILGIGARNVAQLRAVDRTGIDEVASLHRRLPFAVDEIVVACAQFASLRGHVLGLVKHRHLLGRSRGAHRLRGGLTSRSLAECKGACIDLGQWRVWQSFSQHGEGKTRTTEGTEKVIYALRAKRHFLLSPCPPWSSRLNRRRRHAPEAVGRLASAPRTVSVAAKAIPPPSIQWPHRGGLRRPLRPRTRPRH